MLKELLSIPNDAFYPEEIEKNISWCENAFENRGFTLQRLTTETVPLLLAERQHPKAKKTVLIYLQLDGQPVDDTRWFQDSPYSPVLKKKVGEEWQEIPWDNIVEYEDDWRVFARSTSDAKGPVAMFLTALDAIEAGKIAPNFNIKVIMDLARAMERLCPNALLLNFSNPEHKICEAVTRLTEIKTVGLCHGVFMGREQLSELLDVPLEELQTKACGINHFTWFQEIKHKSTGEDLYPKLRVIEQKGDWLAKWHELALGRILFRRFGLWPSPASNHYGEYIRWAEEFVIPQLQFFYDPYDGHPWENNQIPEGVYTVDQVDYDRPWVKDWNKRLLPVGSTEEVVLENEDGSFKSSGEIATLIMEASLSGKKQWLEAVNIPNRGAIPNLPDDLVVEVPAYCDASGIRGVQMEPMPEAIAATIRLHASIHKLLVEAYAEESKDKLLQAILIEPTVSSYRNAVDMCNEMLDLQKDVLPILN